MKRVLVNAYFAINLGDDLFLKILFDRYQDVHWDLLTSNGKYKDIFKEYRNVNIINTLNVNLGIRTINLFSILNDKFFHYKKYDALIIIGGSIFMQNSTWERGLEERLHLPRIFNRMNKPTFIIGANFGPYKDISFVDSYKEYFKLFTDICFRDFFSYNLFKNLDNVRLAPDIVFNLIHKNISKEEEYVGFSLINLENRKGLSEHSYEYKAKMISLIEGYIENGYKIKLFSFCEAEGDLEIINSILKSLNTKSDSVVKVINYDGNIDRFLEEFSSCEKIVGTRFHSIILGFLFNKSVIPLIYSDKTFNVLKDLELNKFYYYLKDIKNLDVEEIIQQKNVMKNREVLSQSEKHFKVLDSVFLKGFGLIS